MRTIHSPRNLSISWEQRGAGPALVLVHGGFSDHRSNWEFVAPLLERNYTLHAIARRGRGETTATEGHDLEHEADDVVELIQSIGESVYLLGHSYGAQVALRTATLIPSRIRKLVLYEPPRPSLMSSSTLQRLTAFAERGEWSQMSYHFFHKCLLVPEEELNGLQGTAIWDSILADAKATLGDLAALARYDFQPERFRTLNMPVMLQIGSESPRELYATDLLASVIKDARIHSLSGQAHEGMTTAPEQYAACVTSFLQGAAGSMSGATA